MRKAMGSANTWKGKNAHNFSNDELEEGLTQRVCLSRLVRSEAR